MSAKAKAPENLSRLQKALRRDQLWEKVRPCVLFAVMCCALILPPRLLFVSSILLAGYTLILLYECGLLSNRSPG